MDGASSSISREARWLNDEDIRFLQGLDTPVKDGDGLVLVPAITGG